MASFTRDGLSLAFDDIHPPGAERTLLLVHGFATSRAENWRRLGWLAAIERKGWRAVAFDHRGHGESDKPHDPGAYSREAMIGDILGLMDHLSLERVDLIGYSMGSHLSLALTALHPDRVSNLVLGGVGAKMIHPDPTPFNATMTMAEAMRLASADEITDKTLKGFRLFAEQQGEDLLALAACSEGRGERESAADLAARINTPTLVVTGSADEIAGDPQVLADAIWGAKCVSLPNCDHFTAIPHALFKAATFDFLEGWMEEMPDNGW